MRERTIDGGQSIGKVLIDRNVNKNVVFFLDIVIFFF